MSNSSRTVAGELDPTLLHVFLGAAAKCGEVGELLGGDPPAIEKRVGVDIDDRQVRDLDHDSDQLQIHGPFPGVDLDVVLRQFLTLHDQKVLENRRTQRRADNRVRL